MKIAVLFSGLLSDKRCFNVAVAEVKRQLPDADIFCTTWEGQLKHSRVDKYFKEPKIRYNSEHYIHVEAVQRLRSLMNKGPLDPKDPKVIKFKYLISEAGRRLGRNRIKQHLGYAMAYEEFITDEYDIVIRARYDLHIKKSVLLNMCKEVMNNNSVVAYGATDVEAGMLALSDFLIVHKADQFNPEHVYKLVNDKQLKTGEAGWWQILVEPYDCEVNQKQDFSAVNMDSEPDE